MMAVGHRAVWVIIAFAALMRVAHADPAEDAYREGRKLYDLQEWDQAIEKFKIAYKLRSDAASLFNIAQAYRLKGDCPEASRTYKSYKRNFPAAANIDKVDQFIAQLEPCANKPASPPSEKSTKPTKPDDQALPAGSSTQTLTKPRTEQSPPRTEQSPPRSEQSPPRSEQVPPRTEQSPRTEPSPPRTEPSVPTAGASQPLPPAPHDEIVHKPRVFTWVALGLSAAALGTGVYFGSRAGSAFDEYKTTPDIGRYDELREQIQTDQLRANISFGTAGGLAVVAAVLFVVEGGRTKTVRVSVGPTSNGFVAWGRF